MNHWIKYIPLFIVLLFLGCKETPPKQITKPKDAEMKNILFIGNSYTYRNCGIDCHLVRLITDVEELDSIYYIDRAAKGKYHFYTHWNDEDANELINSKKWDKVILQEYSSGPTKEADDFFEYGKLFADRFRKINPDVELYLYSTWGYEHTTSMTDSLFHQYMQLGEEIDATVVPVGMLWEELRDSVDLYDGDGAHPNRNGTFLNACLFYEYIFDKDVSITPHIDDRIDVALQQKLKQWAHEYHVHSNDHPHDFISKNGVRVRFPTQDSTYTIAWKQDSIWMQSSDTFPSDKNRDPWHISSPHIKEENDNYLVLEQGFGTTWAEHFLPLKDTTTSISEPLVIRSDLDRHYVANMCDEELICITHLKSLKSKTIDLPSCTSAFTPYCIDSSYFDDQYFHYQYDKKARGEGKGRWKKVELDLE